MEVHDGWVINNGINIHFIDSHSKDTTGIPLVLIPGVSESAEDYLPLMELLSPMRCIAITLRGRGKSDAPQTNYRLEDHVSDIDSVIKHLKLKEFHIMGYSRGVSYTLGYSLQSLELIRGLIIGDYPPFHTKLPTGWAEYFSSQPPWRGKPISDRMKYHALEGIEKESHEVSFYDELKEINFPILIIRGGKEGAILSEEDMYKYIENIPHATLKVFEESDHNIFEPDLEQLALTISKFIEEMGNV